MGQEAGDRRAPQGLRGLSGDADADAACCAGRLVSSLPARASRRGSVRPMCSNRQHRWSSIRRKTGCTRRRRCCYMLDGRSSSTPRLTRRAPLPPGPPLRSARSCIPRPLPCTGRLSTIFATARPPCPASRRSCSKERASLSSAAGHLSDRFAAALDAFGVRPGDRVALILPNCPQFLIAEFGAWKAGASILPLNPLYTAEELDCASELAGARLAVTLTPFYRRLKDVQARTRSTKVIATNIKEYLPPLCDCCSRCSRKRRAAIGFSLHAGDAWFQDCAEQRRSGAAGPA